MNENACKISGYATEDPFQELYDAMQKKTYWIRFFCRPCCPAPDLKGACDMLDKLKGEAMAREDFTDEQKAQIAELIEDRKEWYPTSGLCRKG